MLLHRRLFPELLDQSRAMSLQCHVGVLRTRAGQFSGPGREGEVAHVGADRHELIASDPDRVGGLGENSVLSGTRSKKNFLEV